MLNVSSSSLQVYQRVINENKIKEIRGKGKFLQKSLALLELLKSVTPIKAKIDIIEKDEIIIKILY